jgi:hypothetical protein
MRRARDRSSGVSWSPSSCPVPPEYPQWLDEGLAGTEHLDGIDVRWESRRKPALPGRVAPTEKGACGSCLTGA